MTINVFSSTCEKEIRNVWKTCRSVKKQWLYNRKQESFDYLYHQNYHKRIGADLSRQTNTSIPQQINFVGKLEEKDCVTMFFMAEK